LIIQRFLTLFIFLFIVLSVPFISVIITALQIKKGFEKTNDKVRKIMTDLNDYRIILEVINKVE